MRFDTNLGATIYEEENSILFWGGIFSQWAKCEYDVVIGDKTYKVNCAEQAMMLYKAYTFNDEKSFAAILQTYNPRDQKRLGKLVANFDTKKWMEVAFPFVEESNYQKFTQNKEWGELLKKTDPYQIIEASPYDRIWGIGYGEQDPTVFINRKHWGKDLLGKAIVSARSRILGGTQIERFFS